MGTTLELVQSESHQTLRAGSFFNCLSRDAMKDFESSESVFSVPRGVVLLRENQMAPRVLFLLEGRVKLYINTSDGKRLILRIAQPGEVIGLTSALSGDSSEVTVETVQRCKMTSLQGQDFLDFLTCHPTSCLSVARELSREYSRACQQLLRVGFGSCSPAKVSRLLELCVDTETLTRVLTHTAQVPANAASAPAEYAGLSLVPRKQPSPQIKDPGSVRES